MQASPCDSLAWQSVHGILHTAATHRRGRGIFVWCRIPEEGPDLVHRHWAHLLPAIHSDLQLMDTQVMSVSVKNRKGPGSKRQEIRSRDSNLIVLYNDVKAS